LDVRDGRVVKGVRFEGLRDQGDPAETAARYDAEGADEIVFLDITASHEGRPAMLDVVARTAEMTFTPLTVGGGVRTLSDIEQLLAAGADKVAINSAALSDPDLVRRASDRWGAQAIVVAIDAKARAVPVGAADSARDWDVFSHGGRKEAGRKAVEWAVFCAGLGAGEILLTSMDRDGTKAGYDLTLLRAVSDAVDIPVIASGGVGELSHLYDGLTMGGASAVLAASIFHERTFTIGQAKSFLAARGVLVRELLDAS
jgi:cyclase